MIGVDQRHIQLLGDPPGQKERGKFTLGVDHIRAPLHQLPDPAARQGRPQPDAGIHQPRRHRPDAGHAVLYGGVQILGQRQHPDLVSPQLQLPPQIQDGGHHAVHRRAVPIGCNQNLHSGNASLPHSPIRRFRPGLFFKSLPVFPNPAYSIQIRALPQTGQICVKSAVVLRYGGLGKHCLRLQLY
ncbi:unknown [Oscillibacter sp. CAG:155]|nr:unknown [Oscillibacter sp. CAG:155]